MGHQPRRGSRRAPHHRDPRQRRGSRDSHGCRRSPQADKRADRRCRWMAWSFDSLISPDTNSRRQIVGVTSISEIRSCTAVLLGLRRGGVPHQVDISTKPYRSAIRSGPGGRASADRKRFPRIRRLPRARHGSRAAERVTLGPPCRSFNDDCGVTISTVPVRAGVHPPPF
jgi:hypothetical protein